MKVTGTVAKLDTPICVFSCFQLSVSVRLFLVRYKEEKDKTPRIMKYVLLKEKGKERQSSVPAPGAPPSPPSFPPLLPPSPRRAGGPPAAPRGAHRGHQRRGGGGLPGAAALHRPGPWLEALGSSFFLFCGRLAGGKGGLFDFGSCWLSGVALFFPVWLVSFWLGFFCLAGGGGRERAALNWLLRIGNPSFREDESLLPAGERFGRTSWLVFCFLQSGSSLFEIKYRPKHVAPVFPHGRVKVLTLESERPQRSRFDATSNRSCACRSLGLWLGTAMRHHRSRHQRRAWPPDELLGEHDWFSGFCTVLSPGWKRHGLF